MKVKKEMTLMGVLIICVIIVMLMIGCQEQVTGDDDDDAPTVSNLINNGGLDTGEYDPWTFAAAGVLLDVTTDGTNSVLRAQVTNAGEYAYSTGVYYNDLVIEKGASYSLSFKAKADDSRDIGYGFTKIGPWITYAMETKALTGGADFVDCTVDFTMDNTSDYFTQFFIQLGDRSTDVGYTYETSVYFDDFELYKN